MPSKQLLKSAPNPIFTDLPSLGMKADDLSLDVRRHFTYTLGRDKHCKSAHYSYTALALTIRDRLMERWKHTQYA